METTMTATSGWTPERRAQWSAMGHEKRVEILRDYMERLAVDFAGQGGLSDDDLFASVQGAALALAKRFSGPHGVRAWFEQRRSNYEIAAGTVEPKALPPATEAYTVH